MASNAIFFQNVNLAVIMISMIFWSRKQSYLSPYHIIQRCLCFEDLNCFFDFASTSEGSTTIAGHAGHPEYRPQTRSPISNSKLKKTMIICIQVLWFLYLGDDLSLNWFGVGAVWVVFFWRLGDGWLKARLKTLEFTWLGEIQFFWHFMCLQ